MRKIYFFLAILFFSCQNSTQNKTVVKTFDRPTISFTFDDGLTRDILHYPFKEWNQMILNSLDEANLKSVFFVTGFNKLNSKGKYLLERWNQEGHRIGNHTFSHPNFNDKNVSVEDFKFEFLKTDSIISSLENHIKLFRFPYLKEGNEKERIDKFRNFLQSQNHKNGYVTIDASDWYINSRLIERLKENKDADIEGFKKFYLEHLFDRAMYYEKLSFELHGRHIPHTILLHHNLTSALFLDDLVKHFKDHSWKTINADEAFSDKVYDKIPNNVPAGESLIWALAKESGKYEGQLRYPAEDSRYEKKQMNQLGL